MISRVIANRLSAGWTAALGILCLAAPLTAQDYDTSAGWGGGYISYAPFVEQGTLSSQEIGLGGTWVAVAQFETWHLQRWVGLRLGGFYSYGTVTYPTATKDASIYGVELAGLLRVVPPAPGRTATAYLIGGGGSMWFGLGDGPTVAIADADVVYHDKDRRQWTLLGGGGLEFMTGLTAFDGQLGIRIEGVDQIALSRPFKPMDGADPGMMHNIRVSVALFSGAPRLF